MSNCSNDCCFSVNRWSPIRVRKYTCTSSVRSLIILNCSILLHCVDLTLRCFFVVYVQRRLIFSRRFLFILTTCFGLTDHHHQVYKLLWWRNVLLIVMLFCFSYVFVVTSVSRLCDLTTCFIWVPLNNCYARVYISFSINFSVVEFRILVLNKLIFRKISWHFTIAVLSPLVLLSVDAKILQCDVICCLDF
jgi:hypothetical protein